MTVTTADLAGLMRDIFGEDCWDDGVWNTARRVSQFWMEFMPKEQLDFQCTTFKARDLQQMIIVKNIEFVSLCSHHLLPFYGRAHVGYLPHELMIGVSKIPRIVDFYAHRPTTQERLTHQIAHQLKELLVAKGVGVIIESTHTCMACRGVHKPDAVMVTNELRGTMLTDPTPRNEFLMSIGRGT